MFQFIKKQGVAFYVQSCTAIIALIAMIFGIASSSAMGFSIENIGGIITASVISIVLIVAAIVLAQRFGNKLYVYGALFVSLFLIGICFMLMIMGRTYLIGTVWFTPLDASNPIAVQAMNTGATSFILYLIAIVICATGSFFKIVKEN